MLTLRRGNERGQADLGWLDSRHTFSFADYYDPAHMGFRSLRVINDDRVAAGGGFGTHPHRDMEIVTYVLEGALEHKDSMGNGAVMRPGDVQRMSAGTGIRHSEFNASRTEPVHFLQIWLLPDRRGIAPGYAQKTFSGDDKRNRLRLVASSDGADGSVPWSTDARMYAAVLEPGARVEHVVVPGRYAWIQVASGRIAVSGAELKEGDGASTSTPSAIPIEAIDRTELLVFDLP